LWHSHKYRPEYIIQLLTIATLRLRMQERILQVGQTVLFGDAFGNTVLQVWSKIVQKS